MSAMTTTGGGDYIPALRFHHLTPLYDPLLKWVMRETRLKTEMIQHAAIGAGTRVLDVGCGTGTLTIMAHAAQPDASYTGLDGDPQVLAAARAKSAGMGIAWEHGLAQKLPYPDSWFDRVLSSLVLHHLDSSGKQLALREVHRVLAPGGQMILLDFTAPKAWPTRMQAAIMSHLEQTSDNFAGRIPDYLSRAGFDSVTQVARFNTIFGPVAVWRAGPRS